VPSARGRFGGGKRNAETKKLATVYGASFRKPPSSRLAVGSNMKYLLRRGSIFLTMGYRG